MLASVLRSSFLLVGACVVAVFMLRDHTGLFDSTAARKAAPDHAASPSRRQPRDEALRGTRNQMVIKAGPYGQFFVNARIGYREIAFLVDTGASSVALSRDDAERLGYAVYQLDYSIRTSTANGIARAAPVVIDEIAIGDIVVRDVGAVVIDSPMKGSLLGMTFLRKLAGFEVRDDRLILRW